VPIAGDMMLISDAKIKPTTVYFVEFTSHLLPNKSARTCEEMFNATEKRCSAEHSALSTIGQSRSDYLEYLDKTANIYLQIFI
jgi:hypothetical protein